MACWTCSESTSTAGLAAMAVTFVVIFLPNTYKDELKTSEFTHYNKTIQKLSTQTIQYKNYLRKQYNTKLSTQTIQYKQNNTNKTIQYKLSTHSVTVY